MLNGLSTEEALVLSSIEYNNNAKWLSFNKQIIDLSTEEPEDSATVYQVRKTQCFITDKVLKKNTKKRTWKT